MKGSTGPTIFPQSECAAPENCTILAAPLGLLSAASMTLQCSFWGWPSQTVIRQARCCISGISGPAGEGGGDSAPAGATLESKLQSRSVGFGIRREKAVSTPKASAAPPPRWGRLHVCICPPTTCCLMRLYLKKDLTSPSAWRIFPPSRTMILMRSIENCQCVERATVGVSLCRRTGIGTVGVGT